MVIGFYLITIGFIVLLAAVIPYIVYFMGVNFGKKSAEISSSNDNLPNISIVVCAYNEEMHIADKIRSISSCSYPQEKIELILVVDSSTDKTEEIAESELKDVNFSWKIHVNESREGKNKSLNTGISLTSNEIVFSTDADLVWDKHSAEILVKHILSDDNFAAGTGDLQPKAGDNQINLMEKKYRTYFGRMAEWECESDSTYTFNGCLIVMRKSMVKEVNELAGADDANLAFTAIRNGYRTFYDTRAVIYEDVPEKFKKQYTQKVRRAKGLIQTTLMNRDLLKIKRPFSKKFYPLRIWMYVFTPTILLLGLIVFSIGMILNLPIIYAVIIIALILLCLIKKENLISSFIINQFYLFMGLYSRRKDAVIWESTSKKSGEN